MALPAHRSSYMHDISHYTPVSRRLFDAVRSCKMTQVKTLVLKSHVDVNAKYENGENCLIEVLRIDNDKKRRCLFSFLLKCGINTHNRDHSGRDALEWAVKLQRGREALQLLSGPMIEYDFQHKDRDGLTLLHHATINNMAEVVRAIVKRLQRYRVSVDIPDSLHYTPYLYAKDLRLNEVSAILATAGASVNVERLDTRPSADSEVQPSSTQAKAAYVRHKGSKQHAATNTGSSENKQKMQTAISANLSSLLQLKSGGEICDHFMHSATAAETDSPDTAQEPFHSSYAFNSSTLDLREIFEMVSEQMTQSFCKPAHKPKPQTIIYHQNKSTIKKSALAAILKRPVYQTEDRKRKSHLVRKSSKSEIPVKRNYLSVIPAIKSTFSKQ